MTIISNRKKPVVVILSISSDIGLELAKKYLTDGYQVVGTYRSFDCLSEIEKSPFCKLIYCDISKEESIKEFIHQFRKLKVQWQTFISCVGDLRPLTGFFESDFAIWSRSIHTNAIEQLRVLHDLYQYRDKKKICNTVFFAGGGVNKPVVNFSAYTIAKIMLVKMCEYLDAENKDINIFIVGPGWTKTKIHKLIINDPLVSKIKYRETVQFSKHGKGTDIKKIYESIRWLCSQGKKVAGGRNFSIVYDRLDKKGRIKLAQELIRDPDMYKLRRYRNEYRPD